MSSISGRTLDSSRYVRAMKPASLRGSTGSSLMEMIVVLAILSLLAAMAAPYARKSIRREKEIQLRETLRTVRNAIDQYHEDMSSKRSSKKSGSASGDKGSGYPSSLKDLVEGVESPAVQAIPGTRPAGADEKGKKKNSRTRYMRALPVNPFAPPGTPFEAQWTFVNYQSEETAIATSSYGTTLAEAQKDEKDKKMEIYDVHAVTPEIALDGTRYADW